MKIKTSWDEVTLEEYLKVSKIERTKSLKDFPIKKSIKFAAILSDKTEKEIGLMSNEMFLIILEKISFIIKTEPKFRPNKPFKINGINYIFHNNYNSLTAGEMVSIEQIIKDATEEKRNFLPEVLAVLIRPCISKINKETKKLEHIIEPFETENLEFRRKLLMKRLKVPYFINEIEAFMTGAKRSRIITSLSSVRKNQLNEKLKEISRQLENQSL